jgi:hypothetical protein
MIAFIRGEKLRILRERIFVCGLLHSRPGNFPQCLKESLVTGGTIMGDRYHGYVSWHLIKIAQVVDCVLKFMCAGRSVRAIGI